MKRLICIISLLLLVTGCKSNKINYEIKTNYKMIVNDNGTIYNINVYNDDIYSIDSKKISYIKYKSDLYDRHRNEYKGKTLKFNPINVLPNILPIKKDKMILKKDNNYEYKTYTFKYKKMKKLFKNINLDYEFENNADGYLLVNADDTIYKIILKNDNYTITFKFSNFGNIKNPVGEI